MTRMLQQSGPAIAGGMGTFFVVWTFIARSETSLLVGSIFLGAAIISAQLARLGTEKPG